MRKTILFLVIIIYNINIVLAQEDEIKINPSSYSDKIEMDCRLKFQYGLKVGFNYSNVFDPQGTYLKAKSVVGFIGGVYIVYPIDKGVGLQPEINFSQKGFDGIGKIAEVEYSIKRTTNFIDIPLFFAFKLSPQFTMLIGPQYSYLLNQKNLISSNIASSQLNQIFVSEQLRKNIFGFGFGLDSHINHFVLGLRAQWDVLNNRINDTQTPRYKNALIQCTVGYRFYK
jgi:hypothetical protein